VHLNPVRSRLLSQEERLLDYPWSSLMWYLSPPEHRPAWMRVDRLLGEHGIQEDTPAARQEFERRIESRRLEEMDGEELKAVRRGWCVGSEDFRKRMLESMETMLGENHPAELRQESAEMKAERIIREELNRLGWSEQDLIAGLKCAPEKLVIATRLRKETTLTIRRIAERLHLGTSRSANVRLRKWMRATAFNQSPQSH